MLINKTDTTQIIKIVTADGKKDSINLQPKGRATPPAGSTIDPVAYSSYVRTISGIAAYAPTSNE